MLICCMFLLKGCAISYIEVTSNGDNRSSLYVSASSPSDPYSQFTLDVARNGNYLAVSVRGCNGANKGYRGIRYCGVIFDGTGGVPEVLSGQYTITQIHDLIRYGALFPYISGLFVCPHTVRML